MRIYLESSRDLPNGLKIAHLRVVQMGLVNANHACACCVNLTLQTGFRKSIAIPLQDDYGSRFRASPL